MSGYMCKFSIVWFVRMYGKIIHELYSQPYNNLSISPACMSVHFLHCEIFDISLKGATMDNSRQAKYVYPLKML